MNGKHLLKTMSGQLLEKYVEKIFVELSNPFSDFKCLFELHLIKNFMRLMIETNINFKWCIHKFDIKANSWVRRLRWNGNLTKKTLKLLKTWVYQDHVGWVGDLLEQFLSLLKKWAWLYSISFKILVSFFINQTKRSIVTSGKIWRFCTQQN